MTLGERIGVMKAGKLIQVADPLTLYKRPANQFVAGFIGSPPMNFFPGVIKSHPLSFVNQLFKLELPEGFARALRPEQKVILGIRAEHIEIIDSSEISGTVEVTEQLGNEALVYLRIGGLSCVARTSPDRTPAPRSGVHLKFDRENLHLFDPETKERLN